MGTHDERDAFTHHPICSPTRQRRGAVRRIGDHLWGVAADAAAMLQGRNAEDGDAAVGCRAKGSLPGSRDHAEVAASDRRAHAERVIAQGRPPTSFLTAAASGRSAWR